jgi:hypothetical protein
MHGANMNLPGLLLPKAKHPVLITRIFQLIIHFIVHFKVLFLESKQDQLDATDGGLFNQLYLNMFMASLRPLSGE